MRIDRLTDKELVEALMLSEEAIAIYATEDMIVQKANDVMLNLWGKGSEVVGKPIAEAVPELVTESFLKILRSVWQTGIEYKAQHVPTVLIKEGEPATSYFNVCFKAVQKDGETLCIVHTAKEVAKMREEVRDAVEGKFKSFIMEAPVAIAVLNGKDLVIEMANSKMIKVWKKKKSIVGLPLIAALPELKGQPFLDLLKNVYETGTAYYGYETKTYLAKDNQLESYYFDFVYHPMKDDYGQTYAIMVVATEVSQQVQDKRNIIAAKEKMSSIIMTSPVGKLVLKGKDFLIEEANKPMLTLLEKERDEIIGRPLLEAFPEFNNQEFPVLLNAVFENATPVGKSEAFMQIRLPDGKEKASYVDYTYNPLFDTEGNVEYIVATIIDVTKNVESRNLLNHQKEELQKLNNELSAINGEFAAANEELIALNENLAEAQSHLELSLQQLSESEYLFRSIFEQSKMALCLLRGRELVTQLANDKILEIWGRKREEVIGRPQEEARPELKGQFILDALKRAYDTGEVYFNNEYKANVYCKGKLRTGYFNSVYQPLKNDRGQVTGLLVILEEVTDRVLQKLKSERIQEEFQQAVSTAALGTWSIDASTYMLQLSDRAKELFRLPSGYDPRPDSILNVVDPAFRQQVSNAIRRCLKRHEPFDLDFQVTGVFKEQRKWVRGTGRMFLKANGEPDYLAGILMDITERKEDETRKNDFIAMVSHELKTPLTLIKGYMQLVESRRKQDTFVSSTLSKALLQAERMHTLIRGFLDVARIESGKIPLNKQIISMNNLLLEVLDDAKALYEGYTLNYDDDASIIVFADRDKVMQVVNNFLSNAVKYSPRGSTITISSRVEETMVKVSVIDEGMGISQHDINNLFERFYRVENNNTRSISGFGIGLYLCSEIVKRHGGTIGVESEVSKGSTFWFTIPIERVETESLFFKN